MSNTSGRWSYLVSIRAPVRGRPSGAAGRYSAQRFDPRPREGATMELANHYLSGAGFDPRPREGATSGAVASMPIRLLFRSAPP